MKEPNVEVEVWDLPIRLFHWVLFALLVFQAVSGTIGGDMMEWHVVTGYAILALVVFRIFWGFAGSTHARFASFAAGPRATWHFTRRLFSREAVPQVGHNPLGGWSVMAMVASLLLQGVTGLFAYDGVATQGPLAYLVSIETSNALSDLHDHNFKVLLALAVAHVVAVIYHLVVKKEDLTTPMFTGIKRVPAAMLRFRRESRRDTPPRRVASRENPAGEFPSHWRAAGLLAAAVALVYVIVVFVGRR
ncbi:MAG TPA: cytochrome b/b6 domain-containing protein [Usitatibacter sp.]|jgi:cytochrome b|nr:cytochrome b/b6 domain-containing protein [Usitatibacter sp.]